MTGNEIKNCRAGTPRNAFSDRSRKAESNAAPAIKVSTVRTMAARRVGIHRRTREERTGADSGML